MLHCANALLAVSIPFVEIHLSNVHKREPFRHHSYFSDVAEGVICGLGAKGYEFALQFALDFLNKKSIKFHKIYRFSQKFIAKFVILR